MEFKEKGYKCPACGKGTTSVISTAAFSKYILRTRLCLFCGFKHETGEVIVGDDIFNMTRALANKKAGFAACEQEQEAVNGE